MAVIILLNTQGAITLNDDSVCEAAIAWWNWPVEKISRNLSLIFSGCVRALVSCE